MAPVSTTAGCPALVWEALCRAQDRHGDVSFAATQEPEAFLLVAACRGRTATEAVPVCILNNPEAGAALDHFFDQLRRRVTEGSEPGRGPP